MKILLLNPPFMKKFSRTSRSPGVSKGGCVYYPIWLSYATGALEKAGYETVLLDASGENFTVVQTLKQIKEINPDLIVIDTVTPSFVNDKKVLEKIKKVLPKAFTIFVGDHVSVLPERSLKESKADAVAIKEYDFILIELASALKSKKSLSTVKGIAYRKGRKIILNAPAPEPSEKQLNWLPFVSQIYAKHLKLENYFYPSVQYPQVTILTGRGCPNLCAFCIDAKSVIAIKEKGKIKVDAVSELLDKYLDEFGKKSQGHDLLNVQSKDILIWSNGQFVPIKNISRTIKEKRLKIMVSTGTSIELTADHIIPAIRNNEALELRAGEIKNGDLLRFSAPLPENQPLERIDFYHELLESATKDDLKDIYIHNASEYFKFLNETSKEYSTNDYKLLKNNWKSSGILPIELFKKLEKKYGLPIAIAEKLEVGGKNILPLPFFIPITKDLMNIIGFFVSEGNYNNFSLAIAKSDLATRNEIIRSINETFPQTYVTQTIGSQKRGPQIYFGGKLTYLLFKKVLEIPAGAKNKKLPWIVFNSTLEIQNACLRALYSGDGSWDRARKIKYYTSSEVLAKQLMILLAKKGIGHSLSIQDNRGVAFIHRYVKINNLIYRININNWDARQKFIEEIGFCGKRQNELFEYQLKHKPNRVAVLEQLHRCSANTKKTADALNWSRQNTGHTIAKLIATGEIKKMNGTAQSINQLQYAATGNSYRNTIPTLIKVVSVEELSKVGMVYDVETENNYFTADNIVVHNCKWPQTFSGHNYRKRSVKSVVDEFEWIQNNLSQVKEVMIEDDTLTQDKNRTIELCKELVKRKIRLPWSCNARADVSLAVLQWMKKAKCRLMCVGVESAEQEILNNIKKGTTVNGIRQFMRDSKKAGILVHGCFMFGNQGETKETILKTAAFAREINPDTAQFFPVMVYPGTETYNWAKKKGYLKAKRWKDWLNKDGTHKTLISRPELSAKELNELTNNARKRFYTRPRYIVSKIIQGIKNPKELPRLAKGSITLAKYLIKKKGD